MTAASHPVNKAECYKGQNDRNHQRVGNKPLGLAWQEARQFLQRSRHFWVLSYLPMKDFGHENSTTEFGVPKGADLSYYTGQEDVEQSASEEGEG
jgi:hypothetical protein